MQDPQTFVDLTQNQELELQVALLGNFVVFRAPVVLVEPGFREPVEQPADVLMVKDNKPERVRQVVVQYRHNV